MKKIIIVLFTLSLFIFFSCNNGGETNTQQKADSIDKSLSQQAISENNKIALVECSGTDNLTIEKHEADIYKDHFFDYYVKGSDQNGRYLLSREIWIDADIIKEYGTLFEKQSPDKYDGIRFHNAVKNDYSTIILAPTGPSSADKTVHNDIWGEILKIVDPKQFENYDLEKATATPMITLFEKKYRNKRIKWDMEPTGPIDSLSKSTWINRCVFIDLKKIILALANTDNEVDGIKVIFGAYKDFSNKVPGQKYNNQSTIMLVPTHGDSNGGHIEDWELIKKVAKFNSAYNHGELCPNFCPGQ
jgi:hypothetical protein